MKMRKIISLIVALGVLFSLVACARDEQQGGADRVFEIATDTTFAPFVFSEDGGNTMIGIDMDILEAIAEDQGFDFRLQVVGFQAAMASLESGNADGMMAGMSITEERQERFDFSDPYWDASFGIGVLPDSDISSLEDLYGLQVAAKIGTTGAAFAEEAAEIYGFSVVLFEDSPTMYQDVLAGNSAAAVEDYPVLGFEIGRGLELKIGLEVPRETSYGFAVLKGYNEELLEMFNAGLRNIKESGLYDEIVARYID